MTSDYNTCARSTFKTIASFRDPENLESLGVNVIHVFTNQTCGTIREGTEFLHKALRGNGSQKQHPSLRNPESSTGSEDVGHVTSLQNNTPKMVIPFSDTGSDLVPCARSW
uniref:Uncharacterized protein n=1 Tax=Cannabis sativa TaxID=3483 RepID=A0A803P1B7_CANSA